VRTIGFLTIAALFILPTAAPSSPAVVEGPLLAPGDTWTYRTNTSLAAGLALDGHVTLTVTAHGATEVEGRTYDAYVMSVSGSGTATGTFATRFGSAQASGEWTVSGREILDARGLKILSSVIDLEANGTFHTNPIPLPFALSVQNTTSYRLQGDSWQFPLMVGATASLSSQMNFSEDFRLLYYGVNPTPTHVAGLAWSNMTYDIQAAVGIDTPAGRFDAYPIRETYADGSFALSLFAPVAGNHARTEAHNGTSTVGTADLVSYRYQALEPPTFLGLTTDRWALAAIGIVAVGIALVWWYRRRKRRAALPGPPPTRP
jgi:hypothetical protein